MEKDDAVKGAGNSYTTEFRQYDPRLGRWLSLDPLMMMFPEKSPYVAFGNNPIFFIDPYGLADTTFTMSSGLNPSSDEQKTFRLNTIERLESEGFEGSIEFVYQNVNNRGRTANVTYEYKLNSMKTAWIMSYEDWTQSGASILGGGTLERQPTSTFEEADDPSKNSAGESEFEDVEEEAGESGTSWPTPPSPPRPPVRTPPAPTPPSPPRPPQPVNINLQLNANFKRGQSKLINRSQLKNQLKNIAKLLKKNPNTFIILRGSTNVGGDRRGWDTPTLYGAPARKLAKNRNGQVRKLLMDMGVPANQIKTQLGSPHAGMFIKARVMGNKTP